MKKEYVIKDGNGVFLKSKGEILLFGNHDEALNYISFVCNNSPQFTIEQWRGKEG